MRVWLAASLVGVLLVVSAGARILPGDPVGGVNLTRDSYGDHNNGNVVFTVSDIGVQAYMDFPDNGVGSGFRYPAGGASLLFEGAFVAGIGPAQVSDAMRNTGGGQDRDFVVSGGGDLVISTPGAQAEQQGYAMYNDGAAADPISIQVEQHSYSWSADPNDDFVIVRYVITNTGEGAINGLYAGIYLDWDVTSSDNSNYDAANAVGYQYGSGSDYAGIASLSHFPPATFRSIDNATEAYPPNPTEAAKWGWLTSGFATTSHSGGDISMLMANGPFTIASGEDVVVGFALLGGDNLADLQANTMAARAVWMTVPVELVSFSAGCVDGHVALQWVTASESETYGFNLYRSAGLDDARTRVNESIIPGAGTSSVPKNYSFVDLSDLAGGAYRYWLEEVSLSGATELFGPAGIEIGGVPSSAVLYEPTPNPITEGALIRYLLTERTEARLALYDLSGKMVHVFADGVHAAGEHQLSWNAADIPHGVYLCKLVTPKESVSHTVILLP
ncbi:MAG: T9SS type A sorting domain-containing protein [Candidatus Eisenbacteria bacterium]|jgi:hypothetical protein|nr:T9SS type A sorting domain-containing protein [Candidatus Eisenbacteria bacterium]